MKREKQIKRATDIMKHLEENFDLEFVLKAKSKDNLKFIYKEKHPEINETTNNDKRTKWLEKIKSIEFVFNL